MSEPKTLQELMGKIGASVSLLRAQIEDLDDLTKMPLFVSFAKNQTEATHEESSQEGYTG